MDEEEKEVSYYDLECSHCEKFLTCNGKTEEVECCINFIERKE